jgi:type IX secretion system PorP/SprF family membrane protein
MKKLYVGYIVWVHLIFMVYEGHAQQTPVFSQYFFNELVINPAYAGAHVQLSLTSMYRNQWVNFPGAPRTFSFSGHTSVYGGKMGLGLLVNTDKIGSYNNDNVYGYYAYKIAFQGGTLSMGLQGGFNYLGADFSKLDLVNQSDKSFATVKMYKPNVGAGVYFNRKNFFAGFSVPYLLNKSATASIKDGATQIIEARYYFLRSGVILPLNASENVKFNPSILVRAQEGQPLSFDFNAAFILYDLVGTGLSYRSGDAIISFIDIKLSEKFHFAYSYDWTSSDISRFSNGTHEFMLNFRDRVTKSQKKITCPHLFEYGTQSPIARQRLKRMRKR